MYFFIYVVEIRGIIFLEKVIEVNYIFLDELYNVIFVDE